MTFPIRTPSGYKPFLTVNHDAGREYERHDHSIFPPLIEFLSGSTTLLPGTVILTGTPLGVEPRQKTPHGVVEGGRQDFNRD